MKPIERLMTEWLKNGTDREKRHAEARIAIGFEDADPGPDDWLVPIGTRATPAERPVDRPGFEDWMDFRPVPASFRDRASTCPYRECARGCQKSKCHAGRGDRWGQVTLDDCRRCLTPRDLTFRSYLTSWTGYGGIARHLGLALEREGLGYFRYLDIFTDPKYLGRDPWVQARVREDRPEPGTPVLQLAVPHTWVPRTHPTVVFTMWESTRIDPRCVPILNRALAVVVPCEYNRRGFADSGVTAPIHVVPLGVDPAEGFAPRPVPIGTPFTFGMSARMAHGGVRKGLNEGMAAFVKAFPGGEDVRLEVKVFEDCLGHLSVPGDGRIRVVTEAYTPRRMADWFAGLDVLFVPSKGEGWGLNTHQAMAVGRPVIAADYSGTAEFWTPECGWELPYEEAPAGEFYTGLGEWAVPTEGGMVAALRGAYSSPAGTLRAKGEAAARRASEFTWDRCGRELAKVLRGVDGFLQD